MPRSRAPGSAPARCRPCRPPCAGVAALTWASGAATGRAPCHRDRVVPGLLDSSRTGGGKGCRRQPQHGRSSPISPTHCASAAAKSVIRWCRPWTVWCLFPGQPVACRRSCSTSGRRATSVRASAIGCRWTTTCGKTPDGSCPRRRSSPSRPSCHRGSGDRDAWRHYPGIGDSTTIDDWDPPFPIDPARAAAGRGLLEPVRTTPKAFVPLEAGQRLWRNRYGAVTSIRVPVAPDAKPGGCAKALIGEVRARLDPLAAGIAVRDVRGEALSASVAPDWGVLRLLPASSWWCRRCCWRRFSSSSALVRVARGGLLRSVGFRRRRARCSCRETRVPWPAVCWAWPARSGMRGRSSPARTWWVDAVGTTLWRAPQRGVAGNRRLRWSRHPRCSASGGHSAACPASPSVACSRAI